MQGVNRLCEDCWWSVHGQRANLHTHTSAVICWDNCCLNSAQYTWLILKDRFCLISTPHHWKTRRLTSVPECWKTTSTLYLITDRQQLFQYSLNYHWKTAISSLQRITERWLFYCYTWSLKLKDSYFTTIFGQKQYSNFIAMLDHLKTSVSSMLGHLKDSYFILCTITERQSSPFYPFISETERNLFYHFFLLQSATHLDKSP